MTTKSSTEDNGLAVAAEAAVSKLEALAIGAPGSPELATYAGAAIAALNAAAMTALFSPHVEAVSAAVATDWGIFTGHFSPFGSVVKPLLELHEQSLAAHPELAAAIRGSRGQRLVKARAQLEFAGRPSDWERSFIRFTAEIAQQLHARQLLVPWSTHIAITVPALVTRLESVKSKHETHARAEAQRLAAEAAAAAAARCEQERIERQRSWSQRLHVEDRESRGRRDHLVGWYRRHERYVFQIGPATSRRTMTGAEAAENLTSGDEFLPYFRGQTSGELPMRARA